MNQEHKRTYSVVRKKIEAPAITTLYLVPTEPGRPEFISGQFITVFFPELGLSEGKAYSISSAPHEEGFSITVKDIGAFSHKLSSLEEGDTVQASGPYGYFYSEETDTPLVLIAGGIGIAPFRSIVSDVFHRNPSRKISLYYSVSDYGDALYMDLFSDLAEKHPNFSYTVHVTKVVPAEVSCRAGRISIDRVTHLHKDDLAAEYLMCGSIPFVRDMWRSLRAHNIPEERLYTEAFFA